MNDRSSGSAEESVHGGQKKLDLGKERYRCRVFIEERDVCVVQGWNEIDVETGAAEEAMRILKAS